MERIKQALQRASEERESASTPVVGISAGDSAGTGAAPEGRARPGTTAAPGRAAPAPGGISYTQTRSTSPRARALKQQRVLNEHSAPEVVVAYNVLRTKVLQRLRARGWNALAVTSPASNEGKTLTAVNLSLSLAREANHTVLLADLDLRRPSVHRYFDHRPERGISDYLLYGTPLPEILINPGVERLVVMPGRESIENSSEMLSSPLMVSLVEELKTRYASRIIVFDLPPVLSADDAMAFSPLVDAALLVVADGKTTRVQTERALEHLSDTHVLGTVLNQARDKSDDGDYY